MKILISALLLALSFSSCKQDATTYDDKESYASIKSVRLPSKESGYDKNYDYAVVDSAAAVVEEYAPQSPENPTEKIEQKIIKTGDLSFETNTIDETYNSVQLLVKKYKAIIQNDSQGKSDYSIYRNLNIRIPNENFDAFINELAKGVAFFDRKDISIEDVTEEYIDVASRVKTKKALEERYLELLKRANKVSEMLEIERELATIREEIESKEGRLKYIQNRVSMSTISINFYKTLEHRAGATVSFGTKIVNAIKSGFNSISSFFIGLLEIWPFIIILAVLYFVFRKKFKNKRLFFRRKKEEKNDENI